MQPSTTTFSLADHGKQIIEIWQQGNPAGMVPEYLAGEARVWVARAKREADCMGAAELQKVAELFDIVHRIAYSAPAPRAIIDQWYDRIFRAMRCGEPIDILGLMRRVRQQLHCGRRPSVELIEWQSDILDRWMASATSADPLGEYRPDEAIAIARYLSDENLYAWHPDQATFKTDLTAKLTARTTAAAG